MSLRRARTDSDARALTAPSGAWTFAAHARFLTIVGLGLLVALVYRTTFSDLIAHYSQEDYSALPLVYGVVAFLVWHREAAMARAPWGANWLGVTALALCVVGWHVARSIHVQAAEQVFVIAMIPALVAAIAGAAVMRAIAFPLLFLFAAVPWGEGLYPVLMRSTALVSTFLLQLSGVPVLRNDMYLSLPGGEFRIAEACAGLSYATAGTLLSLLFACMTWRNWKPRVLFLAIAIPFFVLGNGVRAFIVMFVASATNMRYLAGHDHITFGLVFFFVLLVALFGTAQWIGNKGRATQVSEPTLSESVVQDARPYAWRTLPIAAFALFVFGSAAAMDAFRTDPGTEAMIRVQLPSIPGCSAQSQWTVQWQPIVKLPNGEARGSYLCGTMAVNALVAVYTTQQEGRELVSGENVLEAKEWIDASHVASEIAVGNGMHLATNEITIDSKVANEDQVTFALYGYLVNGAPARSAVVEKWLEARASLAFRKVDARVYMIIASASRAQTDDLRAKVREVARTIAIQEVRAQ